MPSSAWLLFSSELCELGCGAESNLRFQHQGKLQSQLQSSERLTSLPSSAWTAAVGDDDEQKNFMQMHDEQKNFMQMRACQGTEEGQFRGESECHTENPKLYWFRSVRGGFNNLRIEFENAVSIAAVTKRTLVIPPPSACGHGVGEFREPMTWDMDKLAAVISVEIGNRSFDEVAADSCVLPKCGSPAFQEYSKLPQHADVNVYAAIDWNGYHHWQYTADQMQVADRAIQNGLLYKPKFELAALQKLKSLGLKPAGFIGIHLRRGDFVLQRSTASASTIVATLKDLGEQLPILIATDGARDDPVIQSLSEQLRLHLTQDVYTDEDDYTRIVEDQLMVAAGKYFIGSDTSTFSAGIHAMRLRIYSAKPVFDLKLRNLQH